MNQVPIKLNPTGGLSRQLENLKTEIGKPRPNRGAKVKAAAVHFQEFFEWRKFSAAEFRDWMKTEEALAPFCNPVSAGRESQARERLQAAGFRDDMPQPFEIIRIGKSSFQLRPPQEYVTSGDIPQAVVDYINKIERKMQKALQACDLDEQDKLSQFAIVQLYAQFKRSKRLALESLGGMQETIDSLDTSGQFLALGDNHKEIEDESPGSAE